MFTFDPQGDLVAFAGALGVVGRACVLAGLLPGHALDDETHVADNHPLGLVVVDGDILKSKLIFLNGIIKA